jgi:hypothetical protein
LEEWPPKADGVVASLFPGEEFEVLFHLWGVVATTMTVRNLQKPFNHRGTETQRKARGTEGLSGFPAFDFLCVSVS